MAETPQGAIIGRFSGATVAAAFTNPLALDLIQVIDDGGNVIFNVDSTGVAHDPAVSETTRGGVPIALIGQYRGATIAEAFSNPSNLDLLQIIQPNDGSIVYYLDYLGADH